MATSENARLDRRRIRDIVLSWFRFKLAQFARLTGALPPNSIVAAVSPEQLVDAELAARLVQLGNAAIANDDDPKTGLGYAAAIRLYSDALVCVASPIGEDVTHSGELEKFLRNTMTETELGRLPVRDICEGFGRSPTDLAKLSVEDRRAQALALRQLCKVALGRQAREQESRTLKYLGRVWRAMISATLAVGLVSLALYVVNAHSDLARNRPWRLSSSLGPACKPLNDGGCGAARPGIFFHTKEEASPWIEYDLGKLSTFTSVVVENARDGMQERAVPLAVEISNDRVHWNEVARATSNFNEWTTSFPKVSARFVRFRVLRASYLHLARIQIRR